ncbi:hypothetical protein AOQ84DRAFT_305275 [Glonium stellatum]|uniref:Rhodopsin domain-containing protein n=1 Tax=Glonium stellatum TaxID=574774 RepID=A0A8E2EPR6_9PEZI|nr:hypothetical protein AOQ84DRAFT_305275 [Glonium stellatum]
MSGESVDITKINPALLVNVPALQPPPGQVSNFDNPPSRAYQARLVIYILLPLMIIHALLRVYTRLRTTRAIGVDDAQTLLKANLSYISALMYQFVALTIKTSILLLYQRLFVVSKSARYLIHFGIAAVVAFYISMIIASAVMCTPRRGEKWLSPVSTNRCAQPELIASSIQGVFGVVSDFYILTIPLLQVYGLHISMSQRIGLTAIFLTGLL